MGWSKFPWLKVKGKVSKSFTIVLTLDGYPHVSGGRYDQKPSFQPYGGNQPGAPYGIVGSYPGSANVKSGYVFGSAGNSATAPMPNGDFMSGGPQGAGVYCTAAGQEGDEPKCPCGVAMPRKVSNSANNPGREFWACAKEREVRTRRESDPTSCCKQAANK